MMIILRQSTFFWPWDMTSVWFTDILWCSAYVIDDICMYFHPNDIEPLWVCIHALWRFLRGLRRSVTQEEVREMLLLHSEGSQLKWLSIWIRSPWMPPSGGVLVMGRDPWENPGHAGVICHPARLGMPWDLPKRAGGIVRGKGSLHVPAQTAVPWQCPTWMKRKEKTSCG